MRKTSNQIRFLHTPDDIDRHYDEAEFKKEAYCEAEESISELLRNYGDSIPTQTKEYWKSQATEILQGMKSHERQLRDVVTRAKENLTAPASNLSSPEESTASEVARRKRKKALSKMKTNEESIESDIEKLEDKIYREKLEAGR